MSILPCSLLFSIWSSLSLVRSIPMKYDLSITTRCGPRGKIKLKAKMLIFKPNNEHFWIDNGGHQQVKQIDQYYTLVFLISRVWVRIPSCDTVSLSKTLNHCFVLRMGRNAIGPMCCVMHVKEPSALIEKRRGSPRCSWLWLLNAP